MANPQVENGYTKIANELLEAIYRVTLSAYEYRVLFYLIRKTYGYGKKMDAIALSQFEQETGIRRSHICRSLSKLEAQNMVKKMAGKGGSPSIGNGKASMYCVQKDYEKWNVSAKRGGSPSIGNMGSPSIGNKVVPIEGHTKERKTKKLNTKKEKTTRSQAERVAVYRMEPENSWNAFMLAYYDRRGFLPPWAEGSGSGIEFMKLTDAMKKMEALGGDKKKLLECWNLYLDDGNKFLQENDYQPRHFGSRLGRYFKEVGNGISRRSTLPDRLFSS